MQQLKNGFFESDPVQLDPLARGPLDGMRFAVKDIFDVAGSVTGIGQPSWRATHSPATRTAPALERLLTQGAELVGKTHTDELCYSIAGQNLHYGIPPNPALPEAIPGGSSSGSVSVVAAGLVDFALGSDTGGSVRVPASYCGVYGIRPTLGAVSLEGAAPLAPSFDTLGWFARDISTLERVGEVLLPIVGRQMALRNIRSVAAVKPLLSPVLERQFEQCFGQIDILTRQDALPLDELATWPALFSCIQGYEAWQAYGSWIERCAPTFGPGIKERFEAASRVTQEAYRQALARVAPLKQQLHDALHGDTVLCLPTAPGSAPALDAPPEEVDRTRQAALRMTAIAGIAGLPQISLPLLNDGRGLVGLSLIGPAGSDRALLALARALLAERRGVEA